jgi:GNAT superfamily N-acetyltransferase
MTQRARPSPTRRVPRKVSPLRWPGPDGYWASDEPSLVDLEVVHDWISRQSYWARGRPRDAVVRSIENSLVIGLYSEHGDQAGFARFVTDYATFAWLCDVFIDPVHRAHGLGSFLVEVAVGHPAVRDIRQVLSTAPERTLYRRHGFQALASPERWMERLSTSSEGVSTAQRVGQPEAPSHLPDQPGGLSM